MKLAIIADWLNPNITEAVSLLRKQVTVDVIIPEQMTINLRTLQPNHDVYIIKSSTDLALSLAGALHHGGARTLNPYPIVSLLRNKSMLASLLESAGLPIPDSYIGNSAQTYKKLLEYGSLIFKPNQGSRGKGIIIVHKHDDMALLEPSESYIIQRYLPSDGYDRKLFCIGDSIYGVKRKWPLHRYEDKLGSPFIPDDALVGIVKQCKKVLDIEIFGMDIILHKNKPYIVDINKFGSFMGVPDAGKLIANFLYIQCLKFAKKSYR